MRVAKREITLPQALADGRPRDPRMAADRRQRTADAPVRPVTSSRRDRCRPAVGAQAGARRAEGGGRGRGRDLVGGQPERHAAGGAAHRGGRAPARLADPKEAKRAEAQRKLALMQKLPSELKLRVAKREISLEDAMREAGIEPE